MSRRAWATRRPQGWPRSIIVLSGDDVEAQARRAGANAILRKPEGVPVIAETVARVLARKKGRDG